MVVREHLITKNGWTEIDEIFYGRCAIGRLSELLLIDCVLGVLTW
jgi:hypothetical protein